MAVIATLIAANTYHAFQNGRGSSDDSFFDPATLRGAGHIVIGIALPLFFGLMAGRDQRQGELHA